MKLKHLDDKKLFAELIELNQDIRSKTTLLLFYLKEVDSRKLFARLGYSSLIEFCIKELKLSETAAYRRVKAMQVLKEIPQIAEKIDSGSLNLNQLSQAQVFFQKSKKELNRPKTSAEKHQVLCEIENKSIRETEKSLFALEPDLSMKPKDFLKVISADETTLKVTLDQKAYDDLQFLKDHFGGRKSLSEIIALLAKEKVEKLQKSAKKSTDKLKMKQPELLENQSSRSPLKLNTAQPAPVESGETPPVSSKINDLKFKGIGSKGLNAKKVKSVERSRHIPKPIQRLVFERAKHKCQYRSPITGKECSSKQYLEIDHIQQFSEGGLHKKENLQLLCFEHHKLKSGVR